LYFTCFSAKLERMLATLRVLDSRPMMKRCRAAVGNDNTQKIVGVAGHKIAFHDLRKARHGRLECIEHRLGLLIERNLNKDCLVHTHAHRTATQSPPSCCRVAL
jgi:hypothetical protein